jgi:hypothetical protein
MFSSRDFEHIKFTRYNSEVFNQPMFFYIQENWFISSMIMIYCHINITMPSFNDTLCYTLILEGRYLVDAILLLPLHRKDCLNKRCMLFEDLVLFKISRPYLSDTSVSPTSLINITIMLVLQMVRNYKLQRWRKHDIHTKYQGLSTCPKVNGGTDT